MKKTLTASDIRNDLLADENAAWSPRGAQALAEYLTELDDECGTETDFDRVAIRCDFAEYESLQEWAEDYLVASDWEEWVAEYTDDGELDEDALDEKIREYIHDNGHLIEFDGGVIVSSF